MQHSHILKMVAGRLHRLRLPVAVALWSGEELQPAGMAKVTLKINQPQALFDLAQPSLGKLAKGYIKRHLDLTGTMRDIISLGAHFCAGDGMAARKPTRLLSWWKHSKPKDRKNVSHHYDVSNDFYALWLDPRRVYS